MAEGDRAASLFAGLRPALQATLFFAVKYVVHTSLNFVKQQATVVWSQAAADTV